MKRVNIAEVATESVDVKMAPLIDCVFLLLTFFVSTTVFMEETGVEVERPRAASVRDLQKESLMLALTADGRIVYAGRELSLNSVRGLVAQHLREKDVPVVIIADAAARTGPLVDLIDECKLAGAKQVSVAASRESR